MIAKKCEGATTAPQMLKDELSKLPPYHYYLLFAITCHLNLLHTYVDHNKMDYRNLCICFQPCMKIDAYCFHFLVCDWKNCWQGCWTEKEYLQVEKEMDEKEQAAARATEEAETESQQQNERAVSSSGSSQQPAEEDSTRPPSRPETSKGRKQRPKNIDTNTNTTNTTSTISHTRSVSQLPELGPPLSPIRI